MKISPSFIQLLSHFTIQTHDAKSAKKAIIGSILKVTVWCDQPIDVNNQSGIFKSYMVRNFFSITINFSENCRATSRKWMLLFFIQIG